MVQGEGIPVCHNTIPGEDMEIASACGANVQPLSDWDDVCNGRKHFQPDWVAFCADEVI